MTNTTALPKVLRLTDSDPPGRCGGVVTAPLSRQRLDYPVVLFYPLKEWRPRAVWTVIPPRVRMFWLANGLHHRGCRFRSGARGEYPQVAAVLREATGDVRAAFRARGEVSGAAGNPPTEGLPGGFGA